MIKAIIFDLDNCLMPARAVGESLYQPAFDAIRAANSGTLPEKELNDAFDECWSSALDAVAGKYGFSPGMLAAGWKVFETLEVSGPITGYGDLQVLAELPVLKFLVTSGFRKLQQSKIDALGLERYFDGIDVDAIDAEDRLGKQAIFARILDTHHLNPTEVIVVGDNEASEIEAGNRLGILTVQTLRPGVVATELVSNHIHSLAELKAILGVD